MHISQEMFEYLEYSRIAIGDISGLPGTTVFTTILGGAREANRRNVAKATRRYRGVRGLGNAGCDRPKVLSTAAYASRAAVLARAAIHAGEEP